ncbi:serine hydrolase [Rhodococcus sp. 3Y1]
MRQLLQHRSGLPEFAGEPGADEWIAANENRTLTPSAAVAIALGKPAQFVPGTSFVYTNTNYIVLGMLVESVSGRSYADEPGLGYSIRWTWKTRTSRRPVSSTSGAIT